MSSWSKKSPEERKAHASMMAKARWAKMSTAERSAMGRKMAKARLKRKPAIDKKVLDFEPRFPEFIRRISRVNQEAYRKKIVAVFRDYYAKKADGTWLYPGSEVLYRHGIQSSQLTNMYRRYGKGARGLPNGRAAATEPGTIRQVGMAKRAIRERLFEYALTSPRVLSVVTEVVKGLASSMGTDRPSPQDIAGYLGKLVR